MKFHKIHRKTLVTEFLFNKVAGLTACRLATLLKKRLWAQVFSCELCEISKNTFSYRTSSVAASVLYFSSSLACQLVHYTNWYQVSHVIPNLTCIGTKRNNITPNLTPPYTCVVSSLFLFQPYHYEQCNKFFNST